MWHKIELLGRLGSDPEMRYTDKGDAVTNFSLAVDNWYNKEKTTIWVRVTVWGDNAENANKYLKKGSQVFVVGRLNADPKAGSPRMFQKKDGAWATSYEVTGDVVKYLSKSQPDEEEPLF